MANDEQSGGFQVTTPEAEIAPPLSVEEEAEQQRVEAEAIAGKARVGKVPLHPAMVRLPFSVGGRLAHEATGYPGFEFSESELKDLAEVWIACGLELSPLGQAIIVTLAAMGIKTGAYITWRRAGKPEPKGKKEEAEVVA